MNESNRSIEHALGQTFGEYRLLRWLGGGGCGEVYLGEHVRDQTLAAVKVLHARLTDPAELKVFINEARTMRLKHPNIVSLLDFGIGANDVPFLVMEYAPHGTLRTLHPKGSRLPLPTIMAYVNPIAAALQYAHNSHLVHRDVKPENMLIGANNQILLSDFGIATVALNTYSSKEQESMSGTIPYMAPEQFEGKPRPASDQYALAIVIYEWLSGARPFQGTMTEIALQHRLANPPSLCEKVPYLSREVEQILLTALAKDPRQRFTSVEVFVAALGAAGQTGYISALSPTSAASKGPTADEAATSTMPTDIVFEPQPANVVAPGKPTQSEPAVPVAATHALSLTPPESSKVRPVFSKSKKMAVIGLALALLLITSTLVYAMVSRPATVLPKKQAGEGSTVVGGTTIASKMLTPTTAGILIGTSPATSPVPTGQSPVTTTVPTPTSQPATTSSPPTPTPPPVSQPTTYAVDGQNPTTYMVNGKTCAETVSNTHTENINFGGITATLYFRFSVTCHAVWAFVGFDKPVPQNDLGNARVVRTNDGKSFTCDQGGNLAVAPGQTSCYTGMVHDGPTETATVYATFTFANGHTGTSAGIGPY